MKIFCNFLGLMSLSFISLAQATELGKYEQVSVSGGHQVTLLQGEDNYAEVEMLKGDRENLRVYVDGETLYVKTKKGLWNSNKTKGDVKVYYNQPIFEINASSGSEIESADLLRSERLAINVSSGASCSVTVESDELDVDISSGARVTASGNTGTQTVDASSGAKYDGRDMVSSYTGAETSSGAKAIVYSSKKLKASCSSGGSVVYYGDPKEIDNNSSKWSGGSVKKGK